MVEQHNTMGKRSAVRTTNSGLPVDHSGPGLRVGPTTSLTADRKSEACPPDSFPSLSQHKSGRESEGGALSGASVASGELRSAATQPVSSLDEIQNNRNTGIPPSFQALGRNRNCGVWTIVGWTADGQARFHRLNCKTWDVLIADRRKRNGTSISSGNWRNGNS